MKSLMKKIKQVTKALLDMAYRSEEMVSLAIKSVIEKDEMLGKRVLANDDKIDSLENKIDRMCLNIFALNQPVAIDLRSVLMISKINGELERIGDMACVIAKRAISLSKKGDSFEVFPEENIKELASDVHKNFKDAIECYINEDSALAKDVILRDDAINNMFYSILGRLIERASDDKKNLARYLDVMDIIKAIERIGDHLSNICEDVIFIETGEMVRHKKILA
jgi:phosphate transport system protein